MKKPHLIFMATIVLAAFYAIPADAFMYTVYTDQANFSAAAGATTLYDFESDPVGLDYMVYDFGDFAVNGSDLYRVAIENENTHELMFNTDSYKDNMSVSFDDPIKAFGFDWRNSDNNDDMVRVAFNGQTYVLGSKDESGFWGVVASEGMITPEMAFFFGDTPGGSGWTKGHLDNFRYTGTSAVPEPATLLLFATGMTGIFLRRKGNS